MSSPKTTSPDGVCEKIGDNDLLEYAKLLIKSQQHKEAAEVLYQLTDDSVFSSSSDAWQILYNDSTVWNEFEKKAKAIPSRGYLFRYHFAECLAIWGDMFKALRYSCETYRIWPFAEIIGQEMRYLRMMCEKELLPDLTLQYLRRGGNITALTTPTALEALQQLFSAKEIDPATICNDSEMIVPAMSILSETERTVAPFRWSNGMPTVEATLRRETLCFDDMDDDNDEVDELWLGIDEGAEKNVMSYNLWVELHNMLFFDEKGSEIIVQTKNECIIVVNCIEIGAITVRNVPFSIVSGDDTLLGAPFLMALKKHSINMQNKEFTIELY